MQHQLIARAPRRAGRRALLRGLAAGGAGAALVAAGCGGRQPKPSAGSGPSRSQAAAAPRPGGTYQATPVTGSPPHLDLQATTSAFAQAPLAYVQSRLMSFKTALMDISIGNAAVPVPNLATSTESPDAITWTLKLRPDVKWHDIAPVSGRPFIAGDVEASFTRLLTVQGAVWTSAAAMIDPSQIATPDDHTIVFKLKYPFAPFPAVLAATTMGAAFPREALAGSYDPKKLVIGTGPFLFDHYTPDVEIVVKRNPDYFIKGQPSVDAVRTAIIPDSNARTAQFIGGHLDVTTILPADKPAVQQAVPAVRWLRTPGNPYIAFFQLGDPSSRYQDIRIRRAFSMAIDREAMGKAFFAGDYTLGYIPPPRIGPKESLPFDQLPADVAQYYKFNPAEAKKLLEAAGAGGMAVTIAYPVPNPLQGIPAAAESVNGFLNAVGLKSTLQPADYTNVYLNNGKGYSVGNFPKDMIVLSGPRGGSTADPDGLLYDYFYSKSQVGAEHLNDPQLDAMIDKERATVNQDERYKACLAIEQYIAEKAYVLGFMPGPSNYDGLQPWVQNYFPGDGAVLGANVWLDK